MLCKARLMAAALDEEAAQAAAGPRSGLRHATLQPDMAIAAQGQLPPEQRPLTAHLQAHHRSLRCHPAPAPCSLTAQRLSCCRRQYSALQAGGTTAGKGRPALTEAAQEAIRGVRSGWAGTGWHCCASARATGPTERTPGLPQSPVGLHQGCLGFRLGGQLLWAVLSSQDSGCPTLSYLHGQPQVHCGHLLERWQL